MFGIGGFELFLILIFGFLIFGPDKLPQIANTLGRAIAKFRTAQEEMSGQLKTQSFIDKDSDNPFKNPLDVIENAASQAKEGADKAQAKAEQVTTKVVEHTESFAERKARYDQERRERKEAEAKARAQQEASASAAKDNPRGDVPKKEAVAASDEMSSDDTQEQSASGEVSE